MNTTSASSDFTIKNLDKDQAKEIALVMITGLNIQSEEEGIAAVNNEMNAGHHFVGIFDESKLIGIATWIRHGRPRHGLAELDHVVVHPDSQGKGVATQLLNGLIESIKEHYVSEGFKLRKFFLLTHADNEKAHGLYKKLGFEYETTLKKHFYDDIDEFLFSMFFE